MPSVEITAEEEKYEEKIFVEAARIGLVNSQLRINLCCG